VIFFSIRQELGATMLMKAEMQKEIATPVSIYNPENAIDCKVVHANM
jgi:hypothetical protein